MLIYPLEEDDKKKMFNLLALPVNQREDLSHLDKNKLLLFAIENNKFALVYDIIQDGANANASVFDKNGNSYGKMLDVAVANLEKNTNKLDSYLVIHGLLRTEAEFEDEYAAANKLKAISKSNTGNEEIVSNTDLLIKMLEVKNKNLLDYPELFKDPENIQNSASFDDKGQFNADVEQENMQKAKKSQSTENDEQEISSKKRRAQMQEEEERRQKERQAYLDDFSDTLQFTPDALYRISYERDKLRASVEQLALKRFTHGILPAPEWLKSEPKFEEQLEIDRSHNWGSKKEKPISNVSDYWLRVQRAELRTSAEHSPLLRGKALTISSYVAFAGLPLATPLWLPFAAVIMGTTPVLMPAAFSILPLIGIAIALTKTPKVIANAIDSARRQFVQREVDSLVKEGLDKGYIDVQTFKDSYSNLINKESKKEKNDILNHKSMEFRVEEFIYAGLENYNKKLSRHQKIDLSLDIPSHNKKNNKKQKGNSKEESYFEPRNKEQAISGLLEKSIEPDADFKKERKNKM